MKLFTRALVALTICLGLVGWDSSQCKKLAPTELKKRLSSEQYRIVVEKGTEIAGTGVYAEHHADGIYVDVATGEPLFSSQDKYDSGTGWPSFTKPIRPSAVITREDHKLSHVRTEVLSHCNESHLGHVFSDGPADRGGLRYCMNSAALRFIPKAELSAQGYKEFLPLFTSKKAHKE